MTGTQDDERRLRAARMQNVAEIPVANPRVEDQLRQAKEALEARTRELARTRGALESTADAIVVTDPSGTITDFNERYLQMWRLEPADLASRDHREVLRIIARQVEAPDDFLSRIESIYDSFSPESFDVLRLADGRVYERMSRAQVVDGQSVGRVWSSRDITERVRVQESLSEHAHILETLNEAGIAVASQIDLRQAAADRPKTAGPDKAVRLPGRKPPRCL